MPFQNRTEAGRLLAQKLQKYSAQPDVVVLGLPRGGVPVAFEVAQALRVPLDVCVVRKLGVPGHHELAMGAIASGGVEVLDEALIEALGISAAEVSATRQNQKVELVRREALYRGSRPLPMLSRKTVIVVDDGLATGATMKAAVRALKKWGLKSLVMAVPVAPESTLSDLANEVDETVCLETPEPFYAVGQWYQDFRQVEDDEVRRILAALPPLSEETGVSP